MSRRSFYLSLVPLGAILFVAVLAASVRAAPASGPGPLGFNAWATVSPVPTAVYGAAVTTDGTYAYAAGGYSFGAGSSVAQFARYNPTSNSWASLASLPDAMDDGAAIYSPINNKIY